MLQFDVDFPRMPCAWISLDAMDISGDMHLDVVSSSCWQSPRWDMIVRQAVRMQQLVACPGSLHAAAGARPAQL